MRRRREVAAGILVVGSIALAGSIVAGRARSRGSLPVSGDVAFVGVRVFDGERLRDGLTVFVRDGRIAGVGDDVALPAGVQIVPGVGKTLLPGFIDAHVHAEFFAPEEILARGITTARDLAWPLQRISRLSARLARAPEDGPRVLFAGPMLTAPGGYPARAAWAPDGAAREVRDATEAREAVRELVAGGVSVIKIAQEPKAGPTLAADVVRAIVEEAHGARLKVTSHCSSLAQLLIALEAGVDELAHGLWSDERIPEDVIARMVAAGMTIVPTLHIDPSAVRLDNFARFVSAGGAVVYGTDMGNPPVPGGIDVEELRLMTRAGMSIEAVLASATSRAALYLGLTDRGRIAEGLAADIILVDGNPAEDLGVLARPLLVRRGAFA